MGAVNVQKAEVKRMKMTVIWGLCLLMALAGLVGCGEDRNGGTVNANEPSTNYSWDDFASNTPAEVDSAMLQTCYFHASKLGYAIKDKAKYQSFLVGKDSVASVSAEDGVSKSEIDENDYLVIFQEIRVVIDAETGAVLGTIPYV